FFRESFSRPQIIKSFIQEYIPSEISVQLDLETLEPVEASFIDPELAEYQSDLLYQITMNDGEPVSIYLLFEHKSYSDSQVSFQLLRYMVKIWEKQLREINSLSQIIPMVIYNGEKPWQIPTDLHSYLKPSTKFETFTPQFNYILKDFSHLSDEQIKGDIWLRVCLGILRAVFSPQLHSELPELIDLAFELTDQRSGLEFIRVILYYLTKATDRVRFEDIQQFVSKQGATGDKIMKTIYDQILEEGERQRAEIIARRLLEHHDIVTVSELTGLDLEVIKKIAEEKNSKK
ncbi:MAG: Rpn family recombination-promoting nuclease/putative transposase, partial [Chloroflexota bacterium]